MKMFFTFIVILAIVIQILDFLISGIKSFGGFLSDNTAFVFVATFIIVIVIGIYYYYNLQKYNLIKTKSKRYAAVLNINKKYNFNVDLRHKYYIRCSVNDNTESNIDRSVRNEIINNVNYYKDIIQKTESCWKLYSEYLHELNRLPPYIVETNEFHLMKLSAKECQKQEENLINNIIYKPVVQPEFIAEIKYYSRNEKKEYTETRKYFLTDVQNYIDAFTTAKDIELVKTISKRYAAVINVNKKYAFDSDVREKYYINCSTNRENDYNCFDFDKAIINELSKNINYYKDILAKIENNWKLLVKYKEELNNLPPYIEKNKLKLNELTISKCREKEEKIINAIIYKPVIQIKVVIIIEYNSSKEKKHCSKRKEYSLKDVQTFISQIEQSQNQVQKKKSDMEYQRSLMTPTLRYQILKRDGFRCTICGRRAQDGVTLHVDHIKPVSKGGLTTPSNLRTLCNECNLGKSDKYDPNGIN